MRVIAGSIELILSKVVATSAVWLVRRGADARGMRKCVGIARHFDGYVESDRRARRVARRGLLLRVVVILAW
jgi:hypothetical protein